MAAPHITLTATFDDLSGVAVGSVQNTSKMILKLAGYGPILPCIQGTAMLVDVDQEVISDDGNYSFPLWANDQIYPLGTYYSISCVDDEGRTVQNGVYQFIANGSDTTIDLSTAPQSSAGLTSIFGEAPNGDFPGTVYTLSQVPINGLLIGLYYNGQFQIPGVGKNYTLDGNVITLSFETFETDTLYAVYLGRGSGGIILGPGLIGEAPSGAFPGTVYGLSETPLNETLIGLYYNGGLLIPPTNYSLTGTTITLTFATFSGDTLYAVYIAV